MSDGSKILWAFLGGAALGAAGLALMNKGKLDFSYLKPMCADLLSKGMDLKDEVARRVETIREDLEDMTAEARDQAEARKKNHVAEVSDTGRAQG